MAETAIAAGDTAHREATLRRRMLLALAAAVSVLAASLLVRDERTAFLLAVLAGVVALPPAWLALRPCLAAWRRRHLTEALDALVEADFAAAVITDGDGAVVCCNGVAREHFDIEPGQPMAQAMSSRLAGAGGLLRQLRRAAATHGMACQDIAGMRRPLRVAVRPLPVGDRFLWRFEEGRAFIDTGKDAASLPSFLLDAEGRRILETNAAFREMLAEPVMRLEQVLVDPPLRPGEVHVLRTRQGVMAMRLLPQPQPTGETRYHLVPGEPGPGAWTQFDLLPVPILKLTPRGRILVANRPARGLLGLEGVIGAELADLVEGLGRPVEEWLLDIAEGRGVTRPEVVRATRHEKEVYLQIAVRPMQDGGGQALLAVLSDATELKTLEAQFVQSQKMQAIGQLAGGVAHDFNNLLTAISGHCDLLLLRHDSSDPDYGDLMQISQNANRAASLVSQLLAFSRKQTLELRPLDLRDTLAEMTHLLNRLVGEKIRLTVRHDPDLGHIRADRRQLEQVVMNLVVNARDAMPEGGEIAIETEMCRLAEPLKRDRATVPAGNYVLVKVRDQGHGIEPEKISKIFEPFFTTKRTGEGTGLGLSTAYGIVKQSGGFIFADSVIGEGTCFSMYFPSCPAPALEASAPSRAPAAAPDGGSEPRPSSHGGGVVGGPSPATPEAAVILLVEDEAPVRAFAARALRLRGHSVLEADSAEAALEMLQDPSLRVDVFVTDVVMPGRDGPSWVAEALTLRPAARVIFVSGYSEDALTRQRSRIPNAAFLQKPFSLAELTAAVQEQLAMHAAEAGTTEENVTEAGVTETGNWEAAPARHGASSPA
ncbi:two-component system, cell cycle sensor histidine kinase and response regulator CckA [Meinhardsimonia xiamenensis]|uniref:histidine kinase n=1 Tax=Meinhardsimonia xiamenensis TaxID=990712 RepID=A0A1G9D7S9_9RHOB|nr:ATP-binding protein [Meinhardsimonia xiamenensis]PRX38097.1 two-component system cell cycle sensor histidine kinase/response regulator CckA [Meinhardsimonia xiamenensis]SDK59996.1 two-component system, cell cycle sensor histidine kinase and response regulator CckA [Meinhardsimonia xiamenensis]